MSKQIITKKLSELKDSGFITSEHCRELNEVAKKFSVSVTPSVIKTLQDKPSQALFTQYIPSVDELSVNDDELTDPIGDETFSPVKGITHRYPDRLLFKPIHTCAVYCRFCFRREKVGRADQALTSKEVDQALEYIKNNSEVWEVILSGGDPLLMSPSKIAYIFDELAKIDHVKVLRIHTRIPLVSPERINEKLISALKTDKALFIVIHCNSHEELTDEVKVGLKTLVNAGIPLLSQSVLLRDVNDDASLLEKLFRALVENRVKPYYLHHADKAEGTSHFRTSIEEGREYISKLRGRVSGICQPTYVLDIPGGSGKVPIGPNYLQGNSSNYKVRDWQGCEHVYKD